MKPKARTTKLTQKMASSSPKRHGDSELSRLARMLLRIGDQLAAKHAFISEKARTRKLKRKSRGKSISIDVKQLSRILAGIGDCLQLTREKKSRNIRTLVKNVIIGVFKRLFGKEN